jgi:hypothetical protein
MEAKAAEDSRTPRRCRDEFARRSVHWPHATRSWTRDSPYVGCYFQRPAIAEIISLSRDTNTGAGLNLTDLAAAVQLRLRVVSFLLRELEQQSNRLLSGTVRVRVPVGAPISHPW